MSDTAKRPALARRITRATEAERKAALETGLAITLDGTRYELAMGDVTSEIARELRRATGMGFRALMEALPRDPDIDLLAAFVWAARRAQGEVIDLETVSISYEQILGDGFDVDVLEGEESEEIRPEA